MRADSPKTSRLPPRPCSESLHAIERFARTIRPDALALADWHRAYGSQQAVRLAHDLDLVRSRVAPGARVFEAGSVPLLLTAALTELGYRVTGCDLAPERYASAIRTLSLDVVACNVETTPLPFADETFDAVVFNELFEHLRIDPIFTLTEVLRVLRPGGVLLLSSPNLRSLLGIRNFLLRNRAYSCAGDVFAEYSKLSRLGHMGHVREYTTTELAGFLAAVGFTVDEWVYRGRYASAVARACLTVLPSLSPFVSYVARKTR